MRAACLVAVLLAGCTGPDYYAQGPCRPPPDLSMGDEGKLAIYPTRLQTRWPSGHVPAVAVGTSKLWIERYEPCGNGELRSQSIDHLIDSQFTPSMATVESSWPRWELIEATVVASEEGEGSLTVTVEVDHHDEEVTDHIPF